MFKTFVSLYFPDTLRITEQRATCATYSINWLVFITETKSVYSAVGTGYLNKAVCASSLLRVKYVVDTVWWLREWTRYSVPTSVYGDCWTRNGVPFHPFPILQSSIHSSFTTRQNSLS